MEEDDYELEDSSPEDNELENESESDSDKTDTTTQNNVVTPAISTKDDNQQTDNDSDIDTDIDTDKNKQASSENKSQDSKDVSEEKNNETTDSDDNSQDSPSSDKENNKTTNGGSNEKESPSSDNEESVKKNTKTTSGGDNKNESPPSDSEVEKQRVARRQAIKSLFESTGGNIPDIEVNEMLKALMKTDKILELDKTLVFSKNESFRIPEFTLDKSSKDTDFFGMDVEDQWLLFDRIGLFKGVVVDYSRENAIEQSYRDVVKYSKPANKGNQGNPRSKPVKVFYKKPRLSGFYETTYAFDEYQKKSQETGIFNLGFGLSASYNKGFASVGVKAGYSYSKESLTETNTNIKQISIITSFFLPKIELSFDTLSSSASDDLIAHLESAFESEINTVACFDQVNKILLSYGQFIPTSLVIGARIYSSDTKEVQETETVQNVLTQHAASFKAAVSSLVFEAGIEAKMDMRDSEKSTEKSKSEKQNMQFNAIGGEGAYVADMNKWIPTTAYSKGWGLVRFDNLVPVLDVLPNDLKKRCFDLFDNAIKLCSIDELLDKGAHFLFHKGYYERFGVNAQPRFCVVKNSIGGKKVLSVKIIGDLENNQEVTMSNYDGADVGDIQEWYFANSGKIYLKSTYNSNAPFVLSISIDVLSSLPKLVITQDDFFDYQQWDVRGGMIKNVSTGYYLNYVSDKIQFENDKNKVKKITWLILSENEMLNSTRKRIEPAKKQLLLPTEGDTDTLESIFFLPIDGTLNSQNGYAQLKFTAEKISIKWGKSKEKKEIWSYPIKESGASKLGIINGSFVILDGKDEVLEDISTETRNITDIQLLDNGNFEAIDSEDKIVWESNSIVFAYIQNTIKKLVLAIPPYISNAQGTEYAGIDLMEYQGFDNQLWYINRKSNIVSKYIKDNKKIVLTELVVDSRPNGYGFTLPGYTTTYAMEIDHIHHIKGQQWEANIANKKGSIINISSKNKLEYSTAPDFKICEDNEKWEIIYDENAKEKSYLPLVTANFNERNNVISFESLKQNQYKFAFRSINIMGKDIRAVRFVLDDHKLFLQFHLADGSAIVSGYDAVPSEHVSFDSMILPNLGQAAYIYDDTTNLDLYEEFIANQQYKFKFQSTRAGIPLKHTRMELVNSSTAILFGDYVLDLEWVHVPDNHKVIGIAFTNISEGRVGPCLISIEK